MVRLSNIPVIVGHPQDCKFQYMFSHWLVIFMDREHGWLLMSATAPNPNFDDIAKLFVKPILLQVNLFAIQQL